MVYKGATDYIETNLCTKGQKKKKKKKRPPNTQRQKEGGRDKKGRDKRSRKKLKGQRLASYTPVGEGGKSRMGAFKRIYPHSPGDNWMGTDNTV